MARRLFYCDHHSIPLPPGHKFPVEKYALLRALLAADGYYHMEPAPFADPAAIERVHEPAYVRAFLSGTLDRGILRQIGFPWSEQLVRRTLASVGGTLAASADALATGFGGNLAGGTHHAFRDRGAGILRVQRPRRGYPLPGPARRGCRSGRPSGRWHRRLFADEESVLTLSLPRRAQFSVSQAAGRIDVALPDGTADDEYLA